MNSIWPVMFLLGALTFLTRLSFIGLFHRWRTPDLVKRALRYVPVAALTAIIVPEMLMADGILNLSLLNPRLLAGLLAIGVAMRTRSVTWTIAVGMVAFWLFRWLFGV
ncbi:MAG: branched-chain amino acid ABC transporter permease [Chloroflexi bacterium HGW-Chloroflexi-6]|nr:MAG: branched-chain amino acid ABC transporter permease [Chloroflexi bacterium HGW-Chloroflexi-6]